MKFEVGTTYYTRSPGDHNCIIALTVKSRTAKTITATDKHGETKTYRLSSDAWHANVEAVRPWGRYSMSPVLEATDTKVLRADWGVAA